MLPETHRSALGRAGSAMAGAAVRPRARTVAATPVTADVGLLMSDVSMMSLHNDPAVNQLAVVVQQQLCRE